MGCPKQFSVQGCMGSALLKTPDVAFSVNYKILNFRKVANCKLLHFEIVKLTSNFKL